MAVALGALVLIVTFSAAPASARLLPLDHTFGDNGTANPTFAPSYSPLEFIAVEPQPDGSLLAALRHGSEGTPRLWRYEGEGRRDPSQDELLSPPEPEVTLPDGRVLTRAGSAALQRLEPDGTLDPSFGSHPWGAGRRSDSVPFTIEEILPLPSGDIAVAGKRMKFAPPSGNLPDEEPEYIFDHLGVARYDEHGELDPSFGDGGVVALSPDDRFHPRRLIGIAARPRMSRLSLNFTSGPD